MTSLGAWAEIKRSNSSYVVGACMSSVSASKTLERPVKTSMLAMPMTVLARMRSSQMQATQLDRAADSAVKNVPGEYTPLRARSSLICAS